MVVAECKHQVKTLHVLLGKTLLSATFQFSGWHMAEYVLATHSSPKPLTKALCQEPILWKPTEQSLDLLFYFITSPMVYASTLAYSDHLRIRQFPLATLVEMCNLIKNRGERLLFDYPSHHIILVL